MIGDIIKEYLVGLGVKIDKPGFSEFESTVNKTSNTISSATGAWVKNFAQASAIIATAIASVNASVVGLMVSSAKQDLAMEKYARNMMVSKKAAWEMKTAVDALGESLQDIYVTPELREQYKLLVGDARRMIPGAGFEGHAKEMRSVIFEFKRLKQEAGYSLNWVGYHLMRSLFGPLKNVRGTMKGLNEYIIKNMPELTAKISRGLLYIVDMGRRLWYAVRDITKALKSMWDSFPIGAKIAIAALTGIVMFLNASPLKLWLLALTAIVVLIDDFYSHLEGKESLFGNFWDALIKGAREAKVFINDVKKNVGELLASLYRLGLTILKMVKDGFKDISQELKKQEVWETAKKTIDDIYKGVTNLVNGLDSLLKSMQKTAIARAFWKTVKEGSVTALKSILEIGSAVGHLANALGYLFSGNYDMAKKHAGMFIRGAGKGISGLANSATLGDFLGNLSAEYESKGSSLAYGHDSTGGHSWGRYQIAEGTMGSFLSYLDSAEPSYSAALRDAGGNGDKNSTFGKAWQGLVELDPAKFAKLEHEFIKQSHYNPAKTDILARTGLDIDSRSSALQNVLWSTAVQHGGGYKDGAVRIFERAVNALGLNASDAEYINYIYDIRGEYFSNSTADEREAVQNRLVNEKQKALAMYKNSKKVNTEDIGLNIVNPPTQPKSEVTNSFTGRLGKHVIDFAKSDYVKQIFSLGGGMGSWDFGNGSSTTVSVGDINVSVAGTNSSAQEIGQAVSSAIQNQSSRAQRLAHGRSLTSPVG